MPDRGQSLSKCRPFYGCQSKAEFKDAKFTILASEVVNLPQTGDKNNVLVGLIALAGFGMMIKVNAIC